MAGYFESLANCLGGTCSDLGRGVEVVLARLGELDFQLFSAGPNLQRIQARAYFSPAWNAAQTITALPETPRLLEAWALKLGHLRLDQSCYLVTLSLPQEQVRLPPPQLLEQWLRALAEEAAAHLYDSNNCCQDCGETVSRQLYDRELEGRFCQECEAERRAVARALLETPTYEDDEIEERLPARVIFPETERFSRRFVKNRSSYLTSLVGWVLLGQIARWISRGLPAALFTALLVVVGLCMAYGMEPLDRTVNLVGVRPAALLTLGIVSLGALLAGVLLPVGRHKPAGTRLSRRQAPEAFQWLDELSKELASPRIDEIILVPGMLASAREYRGGWGYRRYLTLGIPVLETFSQQELTALVGHQLSYLRHTSRLSRWIYLTAEEWLKMAGELHRQPAWHPLAAFSRWYVPLLLTRAQVVCLSEEISAELHAISMTDGVYSQLKFQVVSKLREEMVRTVFHRALCAGEGQRFDCVENFLAVLPEVPSESMRELVEDAFVDPRLVRRLEAAGASPTEALKFELRVENCGAQIFSHYAELRQQTLATLNQRMRLHLKVSERSLGGRRERLERLNRDLDKHPLADERRMETALLAQDLELAEQAEEAWKRLLESRSEAIREVARSQLLKKLLKEGRAREAEPLLKPEELEENLRVQQRLRRWQRCLELCQRMETLPQPPEQLVARKALYQLMLGQERCISY